MNRVFSRVAYRDIAVVLKGELGISISSDIAAGADDRIEAVLRTVFAVGDESSSCRRIAYRLGHLLSADAYPAGGRPKAVAVESCFRGKALLVFTY